MGVCISYSCTAEISLDVRANLIDEVARASREQSWWSEAICLWETENGLAGGTKIFLMGYPNSEGEFREVDPEDDSIMAWRDVTQILQLLQEYSRRYGMTWDIEFADEPFGRISGAESDQVTFEAANEMLRLAGTDPGDPSLPGRIDSIDRAFADRWES